MVQKQEPYAQISHQKFATFKFVRLLRFQQNDCMVQTSETFTTQSNSLKLPSSETLKLTVPTTQTNSVRILVCETKGQTMLTIDYQCFIILPKSGQDWQHNQDY